MASAQSKGYARPVPRLHLKSGIYIIRNRINGKVYVGSSRYIPHRWFLHRNSLHAGTHKNPHLRAAYRTYGKEAFEYLVVDLCPPDVLVDRERLWCEWFNAQDRRFGYNVRDPEPRGPLSEEHRRRISESHMGKRNPMYGRKHPPERIAMMRARFSGSGNPMYGKAARLGVRQSQEEIKKRVATRLRNKLRRQRQMELF